MKVVILLTSAYPYNPGEQFLEKEIEFWAERGDCHVIVAPMTAIGESRSVPAGVKVDLTLARINTRAQRFRFGLAALCSKQLWRELGVVLKTFGFKPFCVMKALQSTMQTLLFANGIQAISEKNGRADVAYSYWNDILSFSALIAKERGHLRRVVSRAHGFDVYAERRRHGYMPLKWQFSQSYDNIFFVAKNGWEYFGRTYPVKRERMAIRRLGVDTSAEGICASSDLNEIQLVSVSSCIPLKRIDKIIGALACLARSLEQNKCISWVHFGDGELMDSHRKLAARELDPLGVRWKLYGAIPNSQINAFYESNKVDIFLNTSETEGVPVSIMEAMAWGVPAIAPDVGGVSEIVDAKTGILLSKNPSVEEIAEAIARYWSLSRENALRQRVKSKIAAEFDAKKNYRKIVDEILEGNLVS